jgi:hypothetical protein
MYRQQPDKNHKIKIIIDNDTSQNFIIEHHLDTDTIYVKIIFQILKTYDTESLTVTIHK